MHATTVAEILLRHQHLQCFILFLSHRNALPRLMAHNVDSVLLGLLCLCTHCCGITLNQLKHKWSMPLKVVHCAVYIIAWFSFFCILGNLCRCTGYRPILEGYKTFCCGGKGGGCGGCCSNEDKETIEVNIMPRVLGRIFSIRGQECCLMLVNSYHLILAKSPFFLQN